MAFRNRLLVSTLLLTITLFAVLGLFVTSGAAILRGASGAAAQQDPTIPPTNTPRATALPTNTPRPALVASATPTASPTVTTSPTATATINPLPTMTATPTATPQTFLPTPTLYYPPEYSGERQQATAIPTAMPRFRSENASGEPYELLNVLLLGHDGNLQPGEPFHTDTMIVVSVNRSTNTVSMISLPRDLYVFIPNWGMQRLNLAWGYGESIGWTDGGWGMMRQTLLHNFGLETHYYAMVDFEGFEQIIGAVGGVTIAVDCPIQDLRCMGDVCTDGIAGNETEDDYELYTLDVGVYDMNAELALWYARSRKNTIDFDRGRRQQQLLRAIWARTKSNGMISEFPNLYDEMLNVVDTNMPLQEIIPLLPLALSIEPNDIENHFFRKNIETVAWSPDGVTNVQLPHPDGGMNRLIFNFLQPPTENRLRLENAAIEVYNATTNEGWDVVAADRLIWEGFAPAAMGPAEATDRTDTLIYDFTGSTKGSSLGELIELLNIKPENVLVEPDPNRTVDYRIVLGETYNSCVGRQWVAPQ